MAKKDNNLWDKNFDGDKKDTSKETEGLSRQSFQKKSRGSRSMVLILASVIALFAAASVVVFMMNRGDFNQASNPKTEVAQSSKSSKSDSKSSSDSSKSSADKQSEKSESESKASESESKASAKKDSESVKKQKEATDKQSMAAKKETDQQQTQKDNNSQSNSSNSTNNASGKYATVQAGQGVYRVAVNNGISVQQLLEMNGLTSSSDIQPGQQLRVK
ncbi:LysM peptidoglycan-binding domain-containing protein [Pediococcus argentinicus]|uniref:LysM peptidoglycan-binding domain-containing protein n=1 Tax=Pediococcus argentinicus TaxID=480391 RepID=UPI00338D96EF